MIVVWILIILGAVAIFRWITGSKTQSSESALEILKKRYTKGEISEEEFDKIKEKITEAEVIEIWYLLQVFLLLGASCSRRKNRKG